MTVPYTLHLGDCIKVMLSMADASVDSIVTDPPYELGFMGKGWDSTGIANSVAMWTEALRVLKPGGHLLAFSGTRTQHRMVCAIEDAGFEIRDQIGWLYGSGFPKSRNIAEHDMDGEDAGRWAGWGTALKPAWEPVCVARKPLAGTVAANVLQFGTGALNIDECRVHADDAHGGEYTVKRLKPGATLNATGGSWRPEGEGAALFHGQMKAGRWPANVVHDGSDEVLASFPDAPGQMADASTDHAKRKTQNVYCSMRRGSQEVSADSDNNGAVGFKMKPGARRGDAGSAARFFYCAKASRADRNEGLESGTSPAVATDASMRECEKADWSIRNGNHHPTVKPTDLMAYLCRLVTPPGGLVLDPFMGSGSTGKAAILEGFRFVGIDMTPEYVEIAKSRLKFAQEERVRATAQFELFSTEAA